MYIIEDWTGKHCYTDKKFNSFDEARDFISQIADSEAWRIWPQNEAEREDYYNGVCEDLYAIEVDRNGNKVEAK